MLRPASAVPFSKYRFTKPLDTAAYLEALAVRLAGAFAIPYAIANQNVSVTASIGFAFAPDHGRTVDELMQRADIALYAAKAGGRDRMVRSEPEDETPGRWQDRLIGHATD